MQRMGTGLPCVALVRPLNAGDPCMFRLGGEYLFPRILRELARQGVCSEVILSVAPDTPAHLVEVCRSWGLPCDIAERALPQQRLADLARRRGWPAVCCVSSYSCFLDAETMGALAQDVVAGRCDYAGAALSLSNQEFCVVGPATLDFFEGISDRSLIPSKPQAIARSAQGRLRGCLKSDMCEPGEEFLWLLTYSGEIATMPRDFVEGFFGSVPPTQWFSAERRSAASKQYFGISDLGWLNRSLRTFFLPRMLPEKLVGQLRWIQRFRDQLDVTGQRVVELGYGELPVLSALLCRQFDEVIALEPFQDDACDDLGELFSFLEKLGSVLPRWFPPAGKRAAHGRLVRHKAKLEDLALPDQSVDCLISKMVFEHVEDVPALSREMRRILRPGGMMLHEIGLNDHTGGTSSGVHFAFLSHSRQEWTHPWRNTNLWRVNDFVSLWQEMGFSVDVVHRVVSTNRPPAIDESWAGYAADDLLCQVAVIRAVRRETRPAESDSG